MRPSCVHLFITAIISISIAQSLNLDPNVPIIWKHIQIQLPRCYSASSSRSRVKNVHTENVSDDKTVARLGLLQLSQPVLCTFYTHSSSLIIFEIIEVNSVTKPCCTIFKVKTCLQFNCGYLHCLKEKETFMGFIKKWVYLWSVVFVNNSVLFCT